MNIDTTTPCALQTLHQALSKCKTTISPFADEISLDGLLAAASACKVIKQNAKRQVFLLQTADHDYFIKCATLTRTKDRVRHMLLPMRKWAEWRNLHWMKANEIEVARPVMAGAAGGYPPSSFFLITARVDGQPLRFDSAAAASRLGRFIADVHCRGIYLADLHPQNILIRPDGRPCLIDVQQAYRLRWLPHRLRVHNLGRLFFQLTSGPDFNRLLAVFLKFYNLASKKPVTRAELIQAASRHRQRYYRSRSKRCCKESTEFVIVKAAGCRGYKRRDFLWAETNLRQALDAGRMIKPQRVVVYQDVCIKIHQRKICHRDRCLVSWKMSRALEVRGIEVPRALEYLRMKTDSFFLSELLHDGQHLNEFLSTISTEPRKRMEIKKLALWLKKIHGNNIWQKDFKSTNVICRQGRYYLLDLESVKMSRLSAKQKIVNLAQLNASLSNAVTVKDRLRFFYYYSVADNPSREKRREIYRKVWEISNTKTTHYYDLDLGKLIQNLQVCKFDRI